MKHLSLKCAAMALAFAASAQAFTVTGKVNDESGKAIEKASVELLKNALKTTTDSKGEFKLFKEEANPGDSLIGIHAVRPRLGYVSVTNGVLSYSQSTNEPVRIQVFDAVGSRVLNETVYGTGTLDMQSIVKSQGSYFARVSVGSAKSNFRFASNGNYGISFGDAVARGLKKEEAGDSLRVIALWAHSRCAADSPEAEQYWPVSRQPQRDAARSGSRCLLQTDSPPVSS